ncbi:MAG: EAL domain-containing protein [Deltaproteobacteria bacterium]|nr:EAL domain-containing protein [Deltaproteobacteria bacterium]
MVDTGSHIYSRTLEPGDIIFREGDAGDSAYIVESGAVEISMIQNGQRTVLTRIGEGGLFGEMAVIDDQPRTATVVALEKTNLVSISRKQINEHLNQGDSVVNLLLKVILTRYRANLERTSQPGKVIAPAMQPDLNQSGVQLESAMSKPAEAAIEAIRLEADLKNGIDRGEFVCFYQPIVDLETRTTAGFEALVRWEHPKRGLLAPFHFIDLAEKTGLIIPLGDYVLERACKDLPELEKACNVGNTNGRTVRPFVSVNVSGRQLGVPGYIDTIRQTLQSTQAPPHQIKLEITESLFMDSPEVAVEWIAHCKEMGITIALDDFGTGFSSLGYLYQFAIDNLKIDRCFVTAMSENERAMKVVRAITGLARGLHLSVVAEGIETPEQMESLDALDCQYGQGYLFSKPVNLNDICELVASSPDWTYGQK